MYSVLKKHSRKLLAIATAALMVAFLLPNRNTSNRDDVIAHIAGKKVYRSQMQQAQYEWHLLMRKIYDAESRQAIAVHELPEQVAAQIEEHPDLFLMLRTEALNSGVYISDERLLEMRGRIALADMDMNQRDAQGAVDEALRGLLMVKEAFSRVASAVRVSQPLRDHEIANRLQQIKMSAVAFAAADYMAQAPAPTADEVKQQFEKYKDIDPGTIRPTEANPFAFGYRFPDRAQIQYLMVPEEQVRKVVVASQTAQRWSVDAQKYYLQHQGEFATTTQPAADPLSLKKPEPIATTRPFAEAEKDAVEAVVKPLVSKRQTEIIGRINGMLSTDWNAYRVAKQGEQPASALGAAYNSYDYLQKLSDVIAKEFKVQLTLGATGALESSKELVALDPIGRSSTMTQLPFAFYATMTEAQRKQLLTRLPNLPPALMPWQPSQVLRDYSGNAFIFRRTIIDPSHAPQNISEVATQVEQDLKTAKAFELAKAAAAQFAKDAGAQGFAVAAQAVHKVPLDTGFFGLDGTTATGIQFSEAGSGQFTMTAMTEALKARAEGQATAVVMVPVQKDGKVVVGQVQDIRSRLQGMSLALVAAEIDSELASQFSSLMQNDWFSYDNVVKRLKYEPTDRQQQKKSDEDSGGAPPATPLGI